MVKPRFNRIALGTVQWGSDYGIANRTGKPSGNEVARILDRAAEVGVRTLDTARAYGESEALIGALTEGDPGWRVITKVSPGVIAEGLHESESLAGTTQSLEQSLCALRRDVLDGVLLHRAAHRTALGGAIWHLLLEWKANRLVGKIGVSVSSPDEALEASRDPTVEIIQVAGSLFDQRLIRNGFFRTATDAGTEVFARSVYLQGVAFLDPRSLPPFLAEIGASLAAASAWARAHGMTLPQLMLAYARAAFDPACVVVGCETENQLVEDLEYWSSTGLTSGELSELDALIPELPGKVLNPALWE